MSDKTGIEWTRSDDGTPGATWNPVTGCTKVSPGCDHCYAETFAERWRGIPGHHFENGFDVTLRPERLDQPLRWKRPRRIFTNSMSDLFHEAVPDGYIAQVFAVMGAARQHTFQVLTKRHGRMRSLLSSGEFARTVLTWEGATMRAHGQHGIVPAEQWPLPNVWLGVSAEDQHWAGIRIPALLDTPAAVRFVSCEPLLGPIDLTFLQGVNGLYPDWVGGPGGGTGAPHPLLDWVITGGESGPGARPMHPAWARQIRDDCDYAEVAFFFKQWGEWGPAPWRVEREPGESVEAYKARAEAACATHAHTGNSYQQDGKTVWHLYEPAHKPWSLERTSLGPGSHEPIRRWGKKLAGRELDGRTWDEFPCVAAAVPA